MLYNALNGKISVYHSFVKRTRDLDSRPKQIAALPSRKHSMWLRNCFRFSVHQVFIVAFEILLHYTT